jgi:A/G-specific adenine glycosylase
MRDKLLRWYNKNKRDLPWRRRSGAYAVLVSEMMLQQTTVETVLRYYEPFMARFPDVQTLAAADEQEVLACWKGLGYYSRARNLHRIARQVISEFGGEFPDTHEAWLSLPGVGPYMAGAVMSIAYGLPYPAVDGNVLRVMSRVFALREDITRPAARKEAEARVNAMMTHENTGDFTQALMELGALVCRPSSPNCTDCPWSADCAALRQNIVDELPIRKSRTAPRTVQLWAALIDTEDSVLLHYRGSETLLAKLWGLPVAEKQEGETPEALFAKKYGISLKDGEVTGHAAHVFTHQRWEMDVVSYRMKSEKEFNTPEWEWTGWESIEEKPIPTAFMRILRVVRKQRAERKAYE